MKVLHITPHLGGGVGKAHAALRGALPAEIEQTFILLEEPRDLRFVRAIEAAGARVIVCKDLIRIADLAARADIVQFEFWNHPRLFECLARGAFPAMRSVFWSHMSGLFQPVIRPELIGQASRFVFTTEASLAVPSLGGRDNVAVINSGFGFSHHVRQVPEVGRAPVIAYLGTVDFIKMHPGFFGAVDALCGDDIEVSVWGAAAPPPDVATHARAMQHPERIIFCGHAAEPAQALAAADIFFYPLQREHYGTSENALIEAMSLGLVPVVLDNPAETAIVRDGETGFVAHSIEECTALLQRLLGSAEERARVSQSAMHYAAKHRTPARAAHDFINLWWGLLAEPCKTHNFAAAIGQNPADWFLATQLKPGESWRPPAVARESATKGTLAHFESVFAGDASLDRLRA